MQTVDTGIAFAPAVTGDRCGVCADPLAGNPLLTCTACGAATHIDCGTYQGGCATYACRGVLLRRRPAPRPRPRRASPAEMARASYWEARLPPEPAAPALEVTVRLDLLLPLVAAVIGWVALELLAADIAAVELATLSVSRLLARGALMTCGWLGAVYLLLFLRDRLVDGLVDGFR